MVGHDPTLSESIALSSRDSRVQPENDALLMSIPPPAQIAKLQSDRILDALHRGDKPTLASVPDGQRAAARALGLRDAEVLRLVELPLALPTLLAGVTTAAVINVGTATVAAFVGAGGLGERIVAGLAVNDTDRMLAGAIPAALLALMVQAAFGLLERRWVPAPLRQPRSGSSNVAGCRPRCARRGHHGAADGSTCCDPLARPAR